MVNALKLVSLNRGFDPREFTLIAFGGGGGMHAVALAAELGISKVVIPAAAAVFSAWGMMMSDLRRDYIATHLIDLVPENAAAIDNILVETEAAARVQFESEGVDAWARVVPQVRQVPLPEPGTHHRGGARRRRGDGSPHSGDQKRVRNGIRT